MKVKRSLSVSLALLFCGLCRAEPNVILMMADDLGYGDVGYNGHKTIRTPNLNAMSKNGLRFDRYYAAAPVCSPTRGSCLTGRHPYRYGIFSANVGHLLKREKSLAERLKAKGYATGHFGKWHLGTLTKTEKDSNRGGPRGAKHYMPPWDRGFDVCFSTEAKVPTWNPMEHPQTGKPYGTFYWVGPGKKETKNLKGDDSRIIMDRAIPFIQQSVKDKKPFFAVIWFHTPHLPVKAGPKYLKMYPKARGIRQHYLGCITAMDEQIGRLRNELRKLKIADDTMLWFASDNGPEGRKNRAPGSAGPLRGRKRDLYEGGVRVPGLLEWPGRIKKATRTSIPVCSSDYVPTVMEILGLKDKTHMDGISLVSLIDGKMERRAKPILFQSRNQVAMIDNEWKLYRRGGKGKFELYNLKEDVGEKNDLSAKHGQQVSEMRKAIQQWQQSLNR